MEISYSTKPFLELEFAGNTQDFKELAHILSQGTGEIIADNPEKPDPYPSFSQKLIVENIPAQKVRVFLKDETVMITGGTEFLVIFAENLKELAEMRSPYHVHFEYFPDHFYLSRESCSLVCSLGY